MSFRPPASRLQLLVEKCLKIEAIVLIGLEVYFKVAKEFEADRCNAILCPSWRNKCEQGRIFETEILVLGSVATKVVGRLQRWTVS